MNIYIMYINIYIYNIYIIYTYIYMLSCICTSELYIHIYAAAVSFPRRSCGCFDGRRCGRKG